MSGAHGVVHEEGVPLRPSISTRHSRQEPNGSSESVAHSFGMSTPANAAARKTDVPAGTVTGMPSISTLTSARPGEAEVKVEIDGIPVTVPAGTSVLRAAALAGVDIPKLCATDSLEPFGSCRLCLVEIEGRKGAPASCTTPAETGMVVHTQTEKLAKLRRGVMELYISDH